MAYNNHINYWQLYDAWCGASAGLNEAPVITHRWSSLCILAAMLERRIWVKQGMFKIYPNMYVQLLGEPASKKSTAIKTAKRLLKKTGYDNFASEKTSMEAFLQDLHDMTFQDFDIEEYVRTGNESGHGNTSSIDDIDMLLDEVASNSPLGKRPKDKLTGNTRHKRLKAIAATMPSVHCMIAADEFMDFIGRGNIEFISLLGSLWDWDDGVYDKKITSRHSAYVNNPLINLLSGNTPDNFALTFPPEIQGQGFFSRILLIHVTATKRKIARMYEPTTEDTDVLLEFMGRIYEECVGELIVPEDIWELIGTIYMSWKDLKDTRFARYSGRRQTHLLKLIMLMTVSRCDMQVNKDDVIMANTILTYAENIMPLAMGEFGRGKNSGVANMIMKTIANGGPEGVHFYEILAVTNNDVDNTHTVQELLSKFIAAKKVQIHDGAYYPCTYAIERSDSEWVKPSWLSDEERNTLF